MYKLSRTKFINWICTSCFFEREGSRIKDDLIKGSEFIVTAQDLLDSVDNVPAHLIDEEVDTRYVRNDQCVLYY
jgi:hypothetical protein